MTNYNIHTLNSTSKLMMITHQEWRRDCYSNKLKKKHAKNGSISFSIKQKFTLVKMQH